MNKPLLICLTPVRNEAWILNAFLKATSLWADYIIIADQNSTDGSREIAQKYPKVIFVSNNEKEMHQANARRLLFEEAKKIEGDKIYFALDADEFLSGDFINTNDWQTIINSQPGELFGFRWINLIDPPTKYTSFQHYYWACHPTEELMNCTFPNHYIHEWRLPCDALAQNLDEICFIHFAKANTIRQQNKEIFYQVSTLIKEPRKSLTAIHRLYYSDERLEVFDVDDSIYSYYKRNNLDILNEIDLNDEGIYYIDTIKKLFKEKGIKFFVGLDIWNKGFLLKENYKDPRPFKIKLFHFYLRITAKESTSLVVRAISKFLKILGF